MCCGLVLLHVVPLHDASLFVQSQVPGSTRGLLPVQHRRVGDVVVLKHRLLELAFGREMLLEPKHDREGDRLEKKEAAAVIKSRLRRRRRPGDDAAGAMSL